MIIKLAKFFSMSLMLFSMSAFAGSVTGKIVDLVTWNDGHSVIKLDSNVTNGCASQSYYSLGIKGKDTKAEPMLSVALAAFISGRRVSVSSNPGGCQGGEEKIVNIRMLSN